MPKYSRIFAPMNLKNILLLTGLVTFSALTLFSYPQGSPVNRTGSPASNSLTCTSCHNPVTAAGEAINITTTISSTGFVANTDYTITVVGTAVNTPRMGFSASVEQGGSFAGTVYPMPNNQKLGDNITHITTSTATTNGQNSWTFRWNSGSATTGATVYVAMLFGNGNGNNSGDRTKTAQLVLTKSTIGLEENSLVSPSFTPNPAHALTRMHVPSAETNRVLSIVDVTGRLVAKETLLAGESTLFLEVSHWKNGSYFISGPGLRGTLVVAH